MVATDRDKTSAARIAEHFYIDEKPDDNNRVINNLQITGGNR
jgi:hypothetical protein